MKKAMFFMLFALILLFGAVFGLKYFIVQKTKKLVVKFEHQVITVSATSAQTSTWDNQIDVTGSTRTVKGVDVTTELAGMIREIDFKPGADVKKGALLVVLDIAPDVAKLHQLQAQAAFAKITLARDTKQYSFGAVSKETLDSDTANFKSTAAQVEEQQATIDKKIIRAPFSGRLGISAVNPGEFINAGTKIVNLQTLDPIYVDFYLPQQDIPQIHVGQEIDMDVDRAPSTTFTGKITTINPIVDTDIRNVEVEATLDNPDKVLLPGMFTNISIPTGSPQTYITLPQMAITFNPYGALVYLLKPTNEKYNNLPVWQATQQFVTTGASRGNQIAVLKGIKVGDMVVTSGQLKLKNGSKVIINNTIAPSDNPDPDLPEE